MVYRSVFSCFPARMKMVKRKYWHIFQNGSKRQYIGTICSADSIADSSAFLAAFGFYSGRLRARVGKCFFFSTFCDVNLPLSQVQPSCPNGKIIFSIDRASTLRKVHPSETRSFYSSNLRANSITQRRQG